MLDRMSKDFRQITWDEQLRADWLKLLRLAIAEDLASQGDRTTEALVGEAALGAAEVVVRGHGVVAGLPVVEIALGQIDPRLDWSPTANDGQAVGPGHRLGRIAGPARGILAAERLVLNALGRLCGIATLTRQYVDAVHGTKARIYDTRKTTPGWRQLEKYAVGCGGGTNHRTGLFDAVLIKDNHLALGSDGSSGTQFTAAEAVTRAKRFTHDHAPEMIVEVEVDTLDQLADVLPAGPDLVLLDNMTAAELREAVARRDAAAPSVELEASGGVTLETIGTIARSGVERISVGALTHSAAWLDLGLDWHV